MSVKMEPSDKRTRRLTYALTELESAMRSAGRPLPAESFGALVRRARSIGPAEFVNEARETIEAALLGERDLGAELIESMLVATSMVDEILIDSQCTGQSANTKKSPQMDTDEHA